MLMVVPMVSRARASLVVVVDILVSRNSSTLSAIWLMSLIPTRGSKGGLKMKGCDGW